MPDTTPPLAPPHSEKCHTLYDTSISPLADPPSAPSSQIIELRVRNHPGTMSHITGLFSRRAFNLDAILCVPTADRSTSRILLLVPNEPRLVQLERQLARLYDVLDLRHRSDLSSDDFLRLADL